MSSLNLRISQRAYYYWLNGHTDTFLNWLLAEKVECSQNTTWSFTGLYYIDKATMNAIESEIEPVPPPEPEDDSNISTQSRPHPQPSCRSMTKSVKSKPKAKRFTRLKRKITKVFRRKRGQAA